MNIPFAGVTQGLAEYLAVLRVMVSGWHASGPECAKFEREFADYVGVDYALTVNSGSSANLLALKALDLPEGSKVITSGCGFPATLSPILHLNFKPVLVDYDIYTQNIDLEQVEQAMKKGAKAIIFAHTMGMPVDMNQMMRLARKYNVKVIEDCCEALGAKLDNQQVGSFGDVATFSFYPSHQINGLGMGGCVVTNDRTIALKVSSLRKWGKLVNEPQFTGDHITSFDNKVDGIDYDEHYTYQTVGFNMLMPDVAAAYLRIQLLRLPKILKARKHNWEHLQDKIGSPTKIIEGAEPAHFGFTILSKNRDKLSQYLEKHGVRTRPFFAGNITRHDPFKNLHKKLPVADQLMKDGMFIGVWPGIKQPQLDYIVRLFTSL